MAVQGIRYETMTNVDGRIYDVEFEGPNHAPCWIIDVCKSHSPKEVHDLIDEKDGPLLKHRGEYLYPNRNQQAIWDDRPSFDEDGNAGYYHCFVCDEELKG